MTQFIQKMKYVIRFLCTVAATTMISSTAVANSEGWHFSGFSEVRAFRFNWDNETSFDRILNPDGSLNGTRIPKEGILLTDKQVNRLEAAVTGNHPAHPIAACFYPHHAFVFYNDKGKIVGHIDICFLCSNYSGAPKGYAESWNLEALSKLIKDLGMPIQNPKWG